jgi:3',5'-cyclic AMP phosphodiesterase CpdA
MKTGHTIRLFLILLLSAILFPVSAFSAEYPPFGIIGDTRIGFNESVYTKFLDRMEKEDINLIFITGDIIDKPGAEQEWKRFRELTGSSRTVHIAAGNHDINTPRSLKVYQQYVDKPPYYAFDVGDTQVLILCTDLPDEISKVTGKQLQWLKEELAKPFPLRIVFLHKPLFPSAYGRGHGLDRYPGDRDKLHELLRSRKVNMVIAGHEHLYNRSEKDGIIQVITGGGGAPLLAFNEENGGFFHYIVAKRRNEGYLLTVYDMSGTTKDQFSIKK